MAKPKIISCAMLFLPQGSRLIAINTRTLDGVFSAAVWHKGGGLLSVLERKCAAEGHSLKPPHFGVALTFATLSPLKKYAKKPPRFAAA